MKSLEIRHTKLGNIFSKSIAELLNKGGKVK